MEGDYRENMGKTISERLVEWLVEQGVERIYGIAGDSLNPVLQAISREPRLRWVHVRHEETAAFAASADAQVSGRVAACCGSCGPGNLHLINGLYDAHRSGAPVFALASHIATTNIGTDYFQETHPTHFFAECTQFRELITCAEHVDQIMGAALRSAINVPGVGMVVLPGDAAAAEAAQADPVQPFSLHCAQLTPCEPEVAQLARLINRSARVTFLCGAGCRGAREEIIALARRVEAPIAYTLRAKEILEADNPLAVGMTGLIGWGDATRALHEAELVVLWGTDFPYRAFLPMHGHVVQVDNRAEALGRRVPICLGIHADVAPTARMLLPLVQQDRGDEFLARSLSRHGKQILRLQSSIRCVDEQAPIRPEYLTRMVSDYAEPDAIFTVDTGTPVIWASRYVQALLHRRIIGSFKHGSMACALAMAVGAKAAFPSRQVIAFCGDGGLSMLPGDMLTLLQERLAVKILVLNNSALDFVALEQELAGMPNMGTVLRCTDYAALARGMGLVASRVEYPPELPGAVRSWLSAQGPALLDVVVDCSALALPPDTTFIPSLDFAHHPLPQTDPGKELDPVRRSIVR